MRYFLFAATGVLALVANPAMAQQPGQQKPKYSWPPQKPAAQQYGWPPKKPAAAAPAKPAPPPPPPPPEPPPPPAAPGWLDKPCEVHGAQGTCKDIADCTGDYAPTPWHCGGPDTVQCCTKKPEATAAAVSTEGPDKAEATAGKRVPEPVAVTAGGEVLSSSDPHEGTHNKGGVLVGIGYRPLPALEIAAGYRGTFGGWSYLMPSAQGGTTLTAEDERIHRVDLGLRYDVLRTVDVPVRLEPYLGGVYQGINSTVYSSNFLGGGGGVRIGYDPDRRLMIQAEVGMFGGGDLANDANTVLGKVLSLWTWGATVGVAPTKHSRILLGYLGEVIDRQHSARVSNGATIALELGFGGDKKETPKAARAAGQSQL